MTIFQAASILLVLAGLASYLNYQYLRLPSTIGLMVIALLLSLGAVVLGKLGVPGTRVATELVASIDFSETLLHGMLAFLLFAGALHVNLEDLRSQWLPVSVLSTIGVALATGMIGIGFWAGAGAIGLEIPLIYGLLFGALISPTDPVAVIGVLKRAGASKSLETKIAGESLFNDGIGVVVFLTLLGIATGVNEPDPVSVGTFLLREAAGGALVGGVAGYTVYRMLRRVDNYPVEILLTLGLAAGTYSLAEYVHVSAPIAVVVAGMLTGNHGREFGMSAKTREHLDSFWELIDEFMNAVLFILIGVELLVIRTTPQNLAMGAFAVVLVLAARFLSVAVPVGLMSLRRPFSRGAIPIMTWAGLRGGISIGLALSLPLSPQRDLLIGATYMVVIFSVLVQGLTLHRVINHYRD
ncbi:MAG: sodium:proton antiporter [Gammaproteobacteria bacterium]